MVDFGGLPILEVPREHTRIRFRKRVSNLHFFSCRLQRIDNLKTDVGFQVFSSESLVRQCPPRFRMLGKLLGPALFHRLCRLYNSWESLWAQARLVAQKPVGHSR